MTITVASIKRASPSHGHRKEDIFAAAKEGNLYKIKQFIENENGDIQELDFRRSTLLHVACAYQRLDVVKYLISKGADVNAKNYCQLTPLHHSCANGHLKLVEVLLSVGADVNLAKDDARTPLHLAAYWGHLAVVWVLLQAGGDPLARARDGSLPGEEFETALPWDVRADVMAVLENARAPPPPSLPEGQPNNECSEEQSSSRKSLVYQQRFLDADKENIFAIVFIGH
mmetsp:Transcript_23174/g.30078  ORF Transcript_23174/g.30078 Transcript_23174/m.30078 type:complete len:228 (+) Transcript_23174:157-840(+)|eukprot:CAMPEP_0117759324 /NCGR_PEP_ID=MMETSP0947-20121206/15946_1 /TAXON_ID=44440 /ORGANISM="Chattonella subsalsa, Strain CCMP2191" /LENGTH=227 /DNA_ID=CAMNT_0005579761 /DNA_START=158 /DNA_END=841 /DNA_ORIENTATION=+